MARRPDTASTSGEALDAHYAELERSVVQLGSLLAKRVRVRVFAWLRKMREPHASTPEWKRSRNDHAQLLLNHLRECELRQPFDSMPPDGPLPSLPPHLRPPRRVAREHANLPVTQQPDKDALSGDVAHAHPARAVNRENDMHESTAAPAHRRSGGNRLEELEHDLAQMKDELKDAREALHKEREVNEHKLSELREQHRQELEQIIQRYGGPSLIQNNLPLAPASEKSLHVDREKRQSEAPQSNEQDSGASEDKGPKHSGSYYHNQRVAAPQRYCSQEDTTTIAGGSLENFEKEVRDFILSNTIIVALSA